MLCPRSLRFYAVSPFAPVRSVLCPCSLVLCSRSLPREPDGFLAPVSLDERHDPVGSHPNRNGQRCSDKGYLAMTTDEYLALLDWTARQQSGDKRGRTPESLPPVLERLSLSPKAWCVLVSQFGRLFHVVAGRPTVIDETRSRVRHQRYRVNPAARELLATAA